MRTPPVPFDSDALRANIASTAQDVVIPERYLPLVARSRGSTACAPRSPRPWASTFTTTATPTADRRLSGDPAAQLGPLRGRRRPRRALRAARRARRSGCSTRRSRPISSRCRCAAAALVRGALRRPLRRGLRRRAARRPARTRGCCPQTGGLPRARRAAARPRRAGRGGARRRRRSSASSTAGCCWPAIAGSTSASTCPAGRPCRAPA